MSGQHPCAICQGACCESLLFPRYGSETPEAEFLEARGRIVGEGKFVEIETRCPHLGLMHGTCGIYATRPRSCRNYSVGSYLCLTTIEARRKGPWGDKIKEAIKNTLQDRKACE